MNANRMDKKWGVIQRLVVEADTFTALRAAIEICMTEHATVGSYAEIPAADGGNALVLSWSSGDPDIGLIPLPLAYTDPAELAAFARHWLVKRGKLPNTVPDTDGSVAHGFHITNGEHRHALVLTPIYTIYGK